MGAVNLNSLSPLRARPWLRKAPQSMAKTHPMVTWPAGWQAAESLWPSEKRDLPRKVMKPGRCLPLWIWSYHAGPCRTPRTVSFTHRRLQNLSGLIEHSSKVGMSLKTVLEHFCSFFPLNHCWVVFFFTYALREIFGFSSQVSEVCPHLIFNLCHSIERCQLYLNLKKIAANLI